MSRTDRSDPDLLAPTDRKLADDDKCPGRAARTKNPCKNAKGSGTDHPGYGYCSVHGGNTEAVIKSSMREMGRDLISRYKAENARFGGNRNDPSIANLTPEQALLEEVRRSAAMVRFLEERIAQWNLNPATNATLEEFVNYTPYRGNRDPSLRQRVNEFMENLGSDNEDSPAHLPALTTVHEHTGVSAFTDAREWLLIYREERKHLATTAKLAIDAGVAQRLVAIAEDQGRILASAIRLVLGALDLTPEQQQMIPRIVPPVLRAVATDSPLPHLDQLLEMVTTSPVRGEVTSG